VPIASGSLLAGKYQLLASIGRGGMGEVFSASHVQTGAEVAVKVVSRTRSSDVLMQRLHREAVAARRIRSDFVPRVYDVDRTEEGELFLVMERLHGESLADRLRARAPLPLTWDEVRRIGDDLLSGLIDAHAAGVVHRDLKPANIFVVGERAFILDFGVCKFDLPDTEKLTTTGESVGTIAYMAPEQIRGASKVDERADLYAFGVVVFEALSGCLPYEATGQMAMIASKLERRARTLREHAQVAFPAALDAVIARALARRPEDRHASAEELRAAWRAMGAANVMPRARTSPAGPLAPLDVQAGRTTGTIDRVTYSSRASRVGLVLAACALGLASVVVVAALRASPAEAPRRVEALALATVDAGATSSAPGPAPSARDTTRAGASRAPDGSGAQARGGGDGTSAGAAAVDAGAGPLRRSGGTRAGAKSAGGPTKRSPAAPHITTEPRY
jgi:serine/threonine protein kinase